MGLESAAVWLGDACGIYIALLSTPCTLSQQSLQQPCKSGQGYHPQIVKVRLRWRENSLPPNDRAKRFKSRIKIKQKQRNRFNHLFHSEMQISPQQAHMLTGCYNKTKHWFANTIQPRNTTPNFLLHSFLHCKALSA